MLSWEMSGKEAKEGGSGVETGVDVAISVMAGGRLPKEEKAPRRAVWGRRTIAKGCDGFGVVGEEVGNEI